MLVTAPGLGKFISGAILYEETLMQKSSGASFAEILKKQGIIAGIKVDKSTKELALFPGETVTEGLDELRERLKKYSALGAQFAKWRATFAISAETPTCTAIRANAHAMARYAALCQEQNIVPIVEPEVLMEGNHAIEKSYNVTRKVHQILMEELSKQRVSFEHTILKTNMVLAGYNAPKVSAEEVAQLTVRCLEHLPANLGGVVFLSGGQSDSDATQHLNIINQRYKNTPWCMTFSYGRGLQREPLRMWASEQNKEKAQKMLLLRAEENAKASEGML